MEPRKRILVVDDEPRIGKVLGIKLKLSGYDVITTANGVEAIDMVRTRKPDIMLLDIFMPGVDGMEIFKKVRSFSQIPIIIFSGRPEVAQLASGLGANDYVAKPFNPDLLVEKIEAVLKASKTVEGHHEGQNENSPCR
jgi:DNA-binding response OmpR family regulator